MSEHYNDIKLGTCEDFRYVRHEEIKDILDCRKYLEDLKTVYRFRWPNEDGQTCRHANGRDMFRDHLFTVPRNMGIEDHKSICLSVGHRGAYNVNVFLPCIVSREYEALHLKNSCLSADVPIVIVGERYRSGKPYTIFACAYCMAWFSLTSEGEIDAYRRAILRHAKTRSHEEWYKQVASRLAYKEMGDSGL